MSVPDSGIITRYLLDWEQGDPQALSNMMPLVYNELRRLARLSLYRSGAHCTLNPTVLVHDAYIRLIDQTRVSWRNRAHFFAIASEIIRRVLVDHARARGRQKRGGSAVHVTLDTGIAAPVSSAFDLVSLNDALERLGALDATQARIVELRFFGGLTVEETAEVMKISPSTVKREWTIARTWLFREISNG